MRAARLEDGRWGIESPYSQTLVTVGRAVPGLKWDAAAKMWAGDDSSVATALTILAGRGLRVDCGSIPVPNQPAEPGRVYALTPWRVEPLRSYQDAGVAFLAAHPAGILADHMGLGKTAQTCGAIAQVATADCRILIVCPNYVRGVWVRELAKWLSPAPTVFLPKGRKPTAVPADAAFVVCHYDILDAWAAELAEWGPFVCVFDEGHLLQNERAKRAQAARKVAAGARFRWVLSGTPMLNRPRDLHNLLDTIAPGAFGGFYDFGIRYCAGHKEAVSPTKVVWIFDGSSYEEELRARLAFYMLRRLKADVSLELPAKTRQIVPVDIKARARNVVWPTSRIAARKMLDMAADQKLPAVVEMLREHVAAGAKVVAFTYRKAVAELLAETLAADGTVAEYIHGGVGADKRGIRISRVAGAPEGGLLAATIDSCSTGIDLTFASVAVFVELTWEPTDLLQGEARLHRYGQEAPVLIQYVIASGTADEVISAAVVSKLATFEKVVGSTGESLERDLDATAGVDIFDSLSDWAAGVASAS